MQRGEIWFAATPGGDRPVLVLTRDPVADRIGSVVVAALTRTRRGLVSELVLTAAEDGVPSDCVVNFDHVHTLPRDTFRRCVDRPLASAYGSGLPHLAKRHGLLTTGFRVANQSRESAESPPPTALSHGFQPRRLH
jgi:mRNA interferase MazF